MLSLPEGVSSRIGQVLEVLEEIRRARPGSRAALKNARNVALPVVARRRGIGTSTIRDTHQRQLGLGGVDPFEDLVWRWLQNGDLVLQRLLEERAASRPASIDIGAIRAFFAASSPAPSPALSVPVGPAELRPREEPRVLPPKGGDRSTSVSAGELDRVIALATGLAQAIDDRLRAGLAGVPDDTRFQWAILKAAIGDTEGVFWLLRGFGRGDVPDYPQAAVEAVLALCRQAAGR